MELKDDKFFLMGVENTNGCLIKSLLISLILKVFKENQSQSHHQKKKNKKSWWKFKGWKRRNLFLQQSKTKEKNLLRENLFDLTMMTIWYKLLKTQYRLIQKLKDKSVDN